jgi:hypothetical protein
LAILVFPHHIPPCISRNKQLGFDCEPEDDSGSFGLWQRDDPVPISNQENYLLAMHHQTALCVGLDPFHAPMSDDA